MSDRYVARVAQLEKQRHALVGYLESKVAACDWHAVQDAATDIREIESRLEEIDDLDAEQDHE